MRHPPSPVWLWLLFAAPAVAQSTQDTTLANGLQVYVAENHRLPEATVVVAVRTGAFTQEARQDGLAHLYEHLLYRAYPHGLQGFEHDAGKIDADFNGETDVDYVEYHLDLSSGDVATAVKMLSQLVRNAHFTDGDIKAERPIVMDEMARDASSPQALLAREVSQRLWGDSWSRVDVIGDSGTIGGLNLDEVQSQYAKYYIPNNSAIFVSGDVSTAAVRKMVADAFGDWTRGPDPVLRPTYVPLGKTTFVLVPGSVSDVTYLVAVQGPANGPADTDAVPAELLARVLDNGAAAFQGRLVGSGTFTSVTAGYRGDHFDGAITFRGRTDLQHASKALLALLNEMDVMDAMQDVSDEDLAFARRADQVAKAIEAEDPNGLALLLSDWWGGPGLSAYSSIDKRFATVKLADLTRIATTYVAGHPRVVGILAPPHAIDVFRNWLSGQGAPK
jgi:zinc protease